jgi:hypothetical protein
VKYRKDVWVDMFVNGIREKIEVVRGRLTYSEVIGVLELVKSEVVKEAEGAADEPV